MYAFLILFWISTTSFLNFLRSLASDDVLEPGSTSFFLVVCWVYCTLLGIALAGFVVFHTNLLIQNYSTIEFVEKKQNATPAQQYAHPWDLGARKNIEECLGQNVWLWLVPTRMSMMGNGVRFHVSAEHRELLKRKQKPGH